MILEKIHEKFVEKRRAFLLHQKISRLLPDTPATVLDIGCGDGSIACHVMESKPNLKISGIETIVRPGTAIPVAAFDGRKIPYPDASFDFCLFVDVLHHAEDPSILLAEAARVARRGVVIKDHLANGFVARRILRFMDDTHNRRYRVALPYNYWSKPEWNLAFEKLGLRQTAGSNALHLYPPWADWLFGGNLHFLGLYQPEKT
jgi:SAM-dependent methyltransferase